MNINKPGTIVSNFIRFVKTEHKEYLTRNHVRLDTDTADTWFAVSLKNNDFDENNIM